MEDQREIFEDYCRERYGEGVRDSATTKATISTSKAVPRQKGERIVKVLKGHPDARDYSPQFKNWVKRRRFQLVSYAALELRDVLCLPAKTQV